MLKRIVNWLCLLLLLVVLFVLYGVYQCLTLSGSNIYGINIVTEINQRKWMNLLSDGIQHQEESTLNNIYFTVKTTPGNYEKRILPAHISWFQKVNKETVRLVSDITGVYIIGLHVKF